MPNCIEARDREKKRGRELKRTVKEEKKMKEGERERQEEMGKEKQSEIDSWIKRKRARKREGCWSVMRRSAAYNTSLGVFHTPCRYYKW